tara:strand:- start:2490 stop:2663 length:174 start_codon:yes stop_codon:yes gene_type:complete
METKKRDITPHKGGRTERFEIRIDPEVKKYIKQKAQQEKCSMADIIENWAEKDKEKN